MLGNVAGGRFLRMAGSDEFQNKLNRSSQPVGGDFTHTRTEGSGMERTQDFRDRNNNGTDDRDDNRVSIPRNPGNSTGPGRDFSIPSAAKRESRAQAQRNNTSSSSNRAQVQQSNTSSSSNGEFDASSVVNKYIQNAARTRPVDIQALDKQIRSAPLYHEAKGRMEDLNTFGDMYRYGREQLPEYKQPDPMKEVESPDFGDMYNRTKKDLDEYKV